MWGDVFLNVYLFIYELFIALFLKSTDQEWQLEFRCVDTVFYAMTNKASILFYSVESTGQDNKKDE